MRERITTIYKCIRESDRMNGSSKGRLIVKTLPQKRLKNN